VEDGENGGLKKTLISRDFVTLRIQEKIKNGKNTLKGRLTANEEISRLS
jgi:hypothetical protein